MKVNKCPKAGRCVHAEDCVNHDTFRGEYLCFESGNINEYERNQQKYYIRKGKKNDKNRKK